MKKMNLTSVLAALTLIAAASLVYVSCTETGSLFDPGTASLLPDSVNAIPAAVTEKETDETTDYETTLSAPRKTIYLTIDDAPLNGSHYIDSVITAEKVKAGIFLVGNSIDGSHRFRKYHERLKSNPHIEIYNHSYSHAKHKYAAYYKNPQKVMEDFEKNEADFGISHKVARLPGRNLWQVGERKKNYRQTGATAAALLTDNGYRVFGWDIEWCYNCKDYTPVQTVDELVDEVEALFARPAALFTANHVVLLMHDQMFGKCNDGNDLGLLIRRLKECGYTFGHLTDYPVSSHQGKLR